MHTPVLAPGSCLQPLAQPRVALSVLSDMYSTSCKHCYTWLVQHGYKSSGYDANHSSHGSSVGHSGRVTPSKRTHAGELPD